eukprot:scaffold1034_cov418-Prasinococcus_capsulatus_cf.AAC.10
MSACNRIRHAVTGSSPRGDADPGQRAFVVCGSSADATTLVDYTEADPGPVPRIDYQTFSCNRPNPSFHAWRAPLSREAKRSDPLLYTRTQRANLPLPCKNHSNR